MNITLLAFLVYFISFFIIYDFGKPIKIIDLATMSNDTTSNDNEKVDLTFYLSKKTDTFLSLAKDFSVSPEILRFNNPLLKEPLNELSLIKIFKGNYIYYTIKEGETLLQVSKNFSIPFEEIVQLNHIDSYEVKKGHVLFLKIPNSKYITKPQFTHKIISYKIKKNETIIDLSKKFNIPVLEIMKFNSLKSQTLYPGQKILLKTTIKKY